MSKYISCVGRCNVNNYSFDIYENENGSASIRPCKLGHHLPKSTWSTYDSVEQAKDFIEDVCGDLEGAQRAMYFWENSGIADKMQAHQVAERESESLARMSDAEKEHYYARKQYEADEKFIRDNNYFM